MADIKRRLEKWKEEHGTQIRELGMSINLLKRDPLAVVGLGIIVTLVILAIFADWIAPYDPTKADFEEVLQPPSWKHLFGTDDFGVDILSKIIYGTRYDYTVALVVVGLSILLGTILGLYCGYYGGIIDMILMRITDVFYAIPGLILAMALSAALGSRGMVTLIGALSFVGWPWYARLIRGETQKITQEAYVEASRAVGASPHRIMFKHILPNTIGTIMAVGTLDVGRTILHAASLGFLGFGAQPGEPEWGRIIADGVPYIHRHIWMVFFAGLVLALNLFGFTLLGDALRDLIDPKLRRTRLL